MRSPCNGHDLFEEDIGDFVEGETFDGIEDYEPCVIGGGWSEEPITDDDDYGDEEDFDDAYGN